MKESAISFGVFSVEKTQLAQSLKNTRQRWIAVMLFSSLSGVLVGLTGLFISGLSWFNLIEKTDKLNQIGTLLIIIAFPLVLFSAHALDKISKIEKEKQNK